MDKNGHYNVSYDDGDDEEGVLPKYIRERESSSPRQVSKRDERMEARGKGVEWVRGVNHQQSYFIQGLGMLPTNETRAEGPMTPAQAETDLAKIFAPPQPKKPRSCKTKRP